MDPSAKAAYDTLEESRPTYETKTGEVIDVLGHSDVWDLLQIPFSVEVAGATTIETDEKGTKDDTESEPPAKPKPQSVKVPTIEVEIPSLDLTMWPAVLLNAVARAVGKPTEKLTAWDFKRIKELDLSSSKLTDTGLEYLGDLTNLRELILDNTQVTDAGLQHLTALTNLEELYLRNTQVTDAGKKAFKKKQPTVIIHD